MTLKELVKQLEDMRLLYGDKVILTVTDGKSDYHIKNITGIAELAEWLKELKDYRERMPSYEAGYNDAKREIALSGEYERAYHRGYMKAMEYCTNKLKDVNKQTEVNADEIHS